MAVPYSTFALGDLLLTYLTDDAGRMGMMLTPPGGDCEPRGALEPLVQLHFRGDSLPNAYGNGMTMAGTVSSDRLRPVSQEREGDAVVTTLRADNGCVVRHRVIWHEGLTALRVRTEVANEGDAAFTLEMITSANLGGLSPYMRDEGAGRMTLYRARSAWSAEGRLTAERLEDLNLDRSWARHGTRVVKFGQLGTMPVRGFFPFAAVEDREAGVIWAMQLACPTSWQFEVRRKDDGLCLSCGLADEDYGHWHKTLRPGEGFALPEAALTAARGDIDTVSQRLLSVQQENLPQDLKTLPVFFNEYCTTWGNPSEENLRAIAEKLRGHDIDYLVMDCGWYGRPGVPWSDCIGDWIPNEQELFPRGLKATADMIRGYGFVPGIWFEAETCARAAEIFRREDLLLRRDGTVLDTDNRRFLDLRLPEVQAYLDERVIGLLRECGFGYIKIDYNDTAGVGCDGAESLGEGLRQVGEKSLRFFRRIRENCPGILIENCSSGGHRLEPSYMGVSDMASFSDAHECPEIPIIAANLHRLILPRQEQIWAVIREEDSLRRITYSLAAATLGALCLSGDILHLTEAQWAQIDRGVAFYRAVGPVIRRGVSRIHRHLATQSWRKPEGWQAVVRTGENGDTMVIVHTFGGELPETITLPAAGGRIASVLCSEGNRVTLSGGELTIGLKANWEAVGVHLMP